MHRLIGGNHYEVGDAVLLGQAQQIPRAQHVVGDRLLGISLHERNVFVRRRVEDHLRAEPGKDLPQPRLIADVGDGGRERQVRKCPA